MVLIVLAENQLFKTEQVIITAAKGRSYFCRLSVYFSICGITSKVMNRF